MGVSPPAPVVPAEPGTSPPACPPLPLGEGLGVRAARTRRGAPDPLSRWERVRLRALVGRAAKEGTRRRRWLATVSERGVVACTKEILGSPGTGCQSASVVPAKAGTSQRWRWGTRFLPSQERQVTHPIPRPCRANRAPWRIDTPRRTLVERTLRVDADTYTSGLARTALCILLQGRRLSLDNSIPAMPRSGITRSASGTDTEE